MADGHASAPTPVRMYQRASIDTWKTNPRTGQVDVTDILATLIANGKPIPGRRITEPLRLRKEGSRYVALKGNRRLMAAAIAGIEELPGIEVSWTDEEALEEALVDEARRALTPLEEAAALARLRDERGLDVEQLAARAGRSITYIRKRLALLALALPVREAIAAGRISLALALGRSGQPGLVALALDAQARALARVPSPEAGEEPIGLRVGAFAVRSELLSLDSAPWELADATLPGGACTSCPKRTGAQMALIDEGVENDECTDKRCHDGKLAAWRERRDETIAEQEVGPEKAKAGKMAREDAFKEPKRHLPIVDESLPKAKPKGSAAADAKAERELEDKARSLALAKICSAFTKRKADEKLWRLLARFVTITVSAMWSDILFDALDRRGLETGSGPQARKRMLEQMAGASEGECRGLVFELLAAADETESDEDVYASACRAAKVDPRALLDELREKAAAAKPKPEPKGKGKRAGKNACPLTEEHVAELLDDLKIKDAHPGAVSPMNVWGCARHVLDRVDEDHPSYVPQATLHNVFGSYGEDCVDVAWHLLVRGKVLEKFKETPRGGWCFKLAPFPGPRSGPMPMPDLALVFDAPPEPVEKEEPKLEAELVKLCAQARTERILVKALKAYDEAKVKAAIARLVEKKRLKYLPGGKLVAA